MSDELSEMVRAAVRDEALAAESEFPYSGAILGRFVRDVRRRRAAGGAMLAVAGVAVVGMAVLGLGRPWQAALPAVTPTPSASSSPSPDSSPTLTPTPTVDPSPTPSEIPTATPPASEETTPPPEEPPPAPPGAVTVIRALPGGGSGEIMVFWDPAPDATGYRVYRADAADGPYRPAASIDVTTGVVTVEYDGWYEYISMVQGIQSPTSVEYTEAIGTFGYFRVTAFNAGGEGPMSVTVCSEPMTGRSPEFPVC